ncbi:MAG: C39 family peptidase [Candidatus Margulisiibacteriota bacterium]
MTKKIIVFLLCLTSCALATTKSLALPPRVELQVPFLCQAPFANWAQPWQDACEEAALIMAVHWAKGYPIEKEAGNREILGLVSYQVKRWGGHHDLTAAKAAALLREYYRFKNYRVVYKFGVEDIKGVLGTGDLVLAPMAGRLLGNKYYRQPGPAYHYLVFIGYDEGKEEFITNDPGTKRGKGYRYKYNVAYNAIHDWAGSKENISEGRKALIVVAK